MEHVPLKVWIRIVIGGTALTLLGFAISQRSMGLITSMIALLTCGVALVNAKYRRPKSERVVWIAIAAIALLNAVIQWWWLR